MPKQLQFNQGKPAEPPPAAPVAASTTPVGQPAAQEPVTGVQGEEGQEKPITMAELNTILAERDKRNRQSLGDQVANRVQMEIQRLAQAGITATPEQVAQLVAQQPQPPVAAPPPAAPVTPPTAQTPVPAPAPAQVPTANPVPAEDPIVTKARGIIQSAGLELDDSPEWDSIDKETDDESVFLASISEAVAAILKRKATEGQPSHLPTLTGGRPSTQPAHIGKSATETLEMGYQKYLPGGGNR